MGEVNRYDAGINRFLEELSSTSLSGTASQMRSQLRAYAIVRSVLEKFRFSGVRVFELPSYLERYERSRAQKAYSETELDFMLRIENVELQLEVKCRSTETISLTINDLQRYQEILRISAKTQEILVVWVNEDLPTMAIDLSKIQRCLLEIKGTDWSVPKEALQPLPDAIKSAFDRHMPVWLKPSEISVIKGPRYDVHDLFKKALLARIQEFKNTIDRRRYEDRKQAINSITDFDVRVLEQIFDKCQLKELGEEQIEAEFRKLRI